MTLLGFLRRSGDLSGPTVAPVPERRVSDGPFPEGKGTGEADTAALLQRAVEADGDLSLRFPSTGSGAGSLPGRLLNRLFERWSKSVTACTARAVALAKLAPRLERLSSRVASTAQRQSSRARETAGSLQVLRESSRDLEAIVDLIDRNAMQTKILAINASIEAVRAGEAGRAFGVVAGEIEKLSQDARDSTARVAEVLGSLRAHIERVALQVGLGGATTGVGAPAADDGLAALAASQAAEAADLRELSLQAHTLSDQLLLAVGVFRGEAHARARSLVEALAGEREVAEGSRAAREQRLRRFLAENRAFELLYLTDTQGRQVTRNIATEGFLASYGSDGLGSDWSGRPWFRAARDREGAQVSDVYRSQASGDYCFTVSCALRTVAGACAGVLGADVRLEQLLDGAN